MELVQALITRRSTRRYAAADVPLQSIEELLELSASAPSACNRRGWRCILVQNSEDLKWLYRRGGSAVFNDTAQALLVCYESQTENSEWADNIQSAAAFITCFQLVAHDRGIGSCWLCQLPPKSEISARFCIPESYSPIACVSFGYYQEAVTLKIRNGASEPKILSLNRWDFPSGAEGLSQMPYQLRRTLRKLYFALPFRGLFRGLAERFEKKFDE